MNFPREIPVVEFLFWLINTAGVGGFIAIAIAVGLLIALVIMFRWIWRGGQVDERRTYAFPTPSLHDDLE